MKCTLIVKDNTILVTIAGVWPKLFTFKSNSEAREVAYSIEEQKMNTNVVLV